MHVSHPLKFTKQKIFRWLGSCIVALSSVASVGKSLSAASLYLPTTNALSPWGTNGTVYAIEVSNGVTYLGGDFTFIAPQTGGGVPLDLKTGQIAGNFPKVDGELYAVVDDGQGGWFIGGSFVHLGGALKNNLAHIRADGTMDTSWNPNPDRTVFAMKRKGSTLYVAGAFQIIGGQSRRYIAALNTSNGSVTSWQPNADGWVDSILLSDTVVYVGGDFKNIGGQVRRALAALDPVTGKATAWNPNPNDTAKPLALSGSTLYVGGLFQNIGGQPRKYLAALDTTTGFSTPWNPAVDLYPESIALVGSTVYMGGYFTSVNNTPRQHVAAVDAVDGHLLPFNFDTDKLVRCVAEKNGTLYVLGNFSTIGGQTRNRIAAIDLASASLTSWNPNLHDDGAYSIAFAGSVAYVGGFFTTANGLARNNLAALDAETGLPLDWNPNADKPVYALSIAGSTIYAGGEFSNVGGASRTRLAALDATSGLARDWNPNVSGTVYSVVAAGNTIYAGGDVFAVRGQSRSFVAAINALTGEPTAWAPTANGAVLSLVVTDSLVYMGGDFKTVNGQPRTALAAVDIVSGNLTPWSPSLSATHGAFVSAMALTDSELYIGGYFTSVGNNGRTGVASVDLTTGLPNSWSPRLAGIGAASIAFDSKRVFAGGDFSEPRSTSNNLVAFNLPNLTEDQFAPFPNAPVAKVAVAGSAIYVGGDFKSINNEARAHYAQIGSYRAATATPKVAAIAPSAGAITGGTYVTITGSNFVAGATIKVGGQLAINPRFVSASKIVVWVPAGLVGPKNVELVNPDGQSSVLQNGYTYTAAGTPSVFLTAPANQTNYKAPATISMAATAFDGDGTIKRVEFYNGATKIGEDVSAPYTFDWLNVSPGVYSITAKAIDNSDLTQMSAAVSVQVNANKLPAVRITSPASGADVAPPANISIGVSATDSDGSITKVEFYNGTIKLGEDTTSPYTNYWTNVPAGIYSITAKATDNSNDVAISSPVMITVRIPNKVPTISFVAPIANAVIPATPITATVAIAVNAADTDGTVTKVEFFQGNGSQKIKIGESVAAPHQMNWTDVKSGSYALTAMVTDNEGATTSATQFVTVNQLPKIAITSPINSARYDAPAQVRLTVDASDPDGSVYRVEYYKDNTKIADNTYAPYSYVLDSLPVGTYSFTAKVLDNLGGATVSSPVMVTVTPKNVLPTVSLVSPQPYSLFTLPATILMKANAFDSDGAISKVEFFQLKTGSARVKLGEALSAPYQYLWSGPAAGVYSLIAQATDNSGGTTEASLLVTVNASPGVRITSPANNAVFQAGGTISIDAIASDSDGVVMAVEFFQGNTRIGRASQLPYNIKWLNVPAGTYKLKATASDNYGASSESSIVSITVKAAQSTSAKVGNLPNAIGPDTSCVRPWANVPDNGDKIRIYDLSGKRIADLRWSDSWCPGRDVAPGTYVWSGAGSRGYISKL